MEHQVLGLLKLIAIQDFIVCVEIRHPIPLVSSTRFKVTSNPRVCKYTHPCKYMCKYLPGDEPDVGGPCPVSHYCPAGTGYPLACPAGTYNNITGQAVCTPCEAGYFCNENTTTYEDFPCQVGYYCPNGTEYVK